MIMTIPSSIIQMLKKLWVFTDVIFSLRIRLSFHKEPILLDETQLCTCTHIRTYTNVKKKKVAKSTHFPITSISVSDSRTLSKYVIPFST